MAKTKQPELLIQPKIIDSLTKQGFLAFKTSDRFKAGKPDLRTSRLDLGQIDFELKYCTELGEVVSSGKEFETGLRLLQQIKMKEMNKHGMPACGLIYVDSLKLFFVTLLLRDKLPPITECVTRGPTDDAILDGEALYRITKDYLNSYHKGQKN